MTIKLAENLGRPHVALLKRHGYDADRVFDQNLSGVVDAELWVHVKREGRFLITLDLGFSDVRRHAPGTPPGILEQFGVRVMTAQEFLRAIGELP